MKAWKQIESFQQSYLRNGVQGFETQKPYLKDLAETHERRFADSKDWRDALKVRTLDLRFSSSKESSGNEVLLLFTSTA